MSNPILIIVVEDDKSIAELIRYNLESESYRVLHFENGLAMFESLKYQKSPIALFILDVMLPGQDGFEICAKLKQHEKYRWSSFLFLTARSSESDKLQGFQVGADDFLIKPFGMRELLARVKALITRHQERLALLEGKILPVHRSSTKSKADESAIIRMDEIVLDDAGHRVYVAQREIEMTHREYELLKFLMLNKGLAFTRDDLLNHVWGYEYSGETRTVDVHIRQLRRKIEENPSKPFYIQTVRGVGYRFRDSQDVG